MKNIDSIIKSFDKYILMGEALNEEIMQNEECIENGTLINKIIFLFIFNP